MVDDEVKAGLVTPPDALGRREAREEGGVVGMDVGVGRGRIWVMWTFRIILEDLAKVGRENEKEGPVDEDMDRERNDMVTDMPQAESR